VGVAVGVPASCPKAIAAGKATKTASTTSRSGNEALNLDIMLDGLSFVISAFTTALLDELSTIRALDSSSRGSWAILLTSWIIPRIIG